MTQHMTDKTTPRWYCLNNDGMATLCKDEADALKTAADANQAWRTVAPHRAVMLVPVTPLALPVPELIFRSRWPGDPSGYSEAQMRAYAAAARRAALEEAALALDAQHEARKQHDNHAAVYARMVRELI